MMFHEDPERWVHGAYIKIGYFEKSDSDLIYQDEIHGPLIEQVDKTIDLIYTKYLKALIWYDGIQRVETFMFPQAGCRELVLNAVQHKDYLRPIPIQISVYPDKIYIFNVGEMPDVLTPANKLFQKHPSLPRNHHIATTFFRSGMVESWGRGYEKVVEACEATDANLPVVEADFGGLMVRIDESKKYQELRLNVSSMRQDETINETLNETIKSTEEQILALVSKNSNVTISELVALTGKSRATVTRILKLMKDNGIIERVGARKDGQWRIL